MNTDFELLLLNKLRCNMKGSYVFVHNSVKNMRIEKHCILYMKTKFI